MGGVGGCAVSLPAPLEVLKRRRPWPQIPQQRFQAAWLQNPILKGIPESGHFLLDDPSKQDGEQIRPQGFQKGSQAAREEGRVGGDPAGPPGAEESTRVSRSKAAEGHLPRALGEKQPPRDPESPAQS